MNSTIQAVTERIIKRSKSTRDAYLAAMKDNMRPGPRRRRLTEGNLAHAAAACPLHEGKTAWSCLYYLAIRLR